MTNTHSMPSDTQPQGEVITPTDAKQARRGTHTFRVLVISLFLVLAAFAILYFASARPSAPQAPPAAPQSTTNPAHDPANP